ncbi:MAG: Flp pilus assembly protein CpaB [Janthinobacterium lividum]
MNGRRLLAALCFALLCSGLLTWQLSRHLGHLAAPARAIPVRSIVIAAKNMPAGEAIAASSLTTVTVNVSQPFVDLFSKPQELVGRVLLVPVASGESVSAHDLAPLGAPTGLAATIPDGMRLVSIPAADQAAGSAGLVASGNHVDILVSYRSEAQSDFVSSMVLQDVPVLASEQKNANGTADTKLLSSDTIELLVTPQDAARLTVASSLGKLTFALRNGADKALSSGLAQVTLIPLQSHMHKASEPVVAAHQNASPEHGQKGFTVETLSGGKSSVQTFSEDQQ